MRELRASSPYFGQTRPPKPRGLGSWEWIEGSSYVVRPHGEGYREPFGEWVDMCKTSAWIHCLEYGSTSAFGEPTKAARDECARMLELCPREYFGQQLSTERDGWHQQQDEWWAIYRRGHDSPAHGLLGWVWLRPDLAMALHWELNAGLNAARAVDYESPTRGNLYLVTDIQGVVAPLRARGFPYFRW